MERLEQQFEFILEIDKEKNIERQTYLSRVGCAKRMMQNMLGMRR